MYAIHGFKRKTRTSVVVEDSSLWRLFFIYFYYLQEHCFGKDIKFELSSYVTSIFCR